jgi:hypothetical protein
LEQNDCDTARDIKNNIYVDNVISGTDNPEQVLAYYADANKLMKSAGFNLRAWSTNCDILQDRTRQDQTFCQDKDVYVLGLRWNIENDHLAYPKKSTADNDLVTKR